MILAKIDGTDLLVIVAIGILCAITFLISGIMLLVTKNTNLISKKLQFNDTNKFCFEYGLTQVVCSLLTLVALILVIVYTKLYLTFVMIAGVSILTILILQYVISNKYRKN